MADGGVIDRRPAAEGPSVALSRPLYPLALAVLRLNAAPAALILAILLLLNIAQSFTGPTIAHAPLRLACIVMAAHAAYRVLLTGGEVYGCRALTAPGGRAPLRFLGTMVLIFLPIVLLGAVWTTPGGPEMIGGLYFIAAIFVMVVAYGVLLVLMGTALPELADTGHADPKASLKRGLANYRRIAWGILLGPGLFGMLHGAVLVVAGLLGLPQGAYNPETGVFSPGALAVLAILTLGNLYSVTLAAVVLTRAYRSDTA